jgi:rod shape-determining protein MreD
MPWLLPHGWMEYVSLHFVLVGILLIGLFSNRQTAGLYGLLFGFLTDILHFVHMTGLYAFLFALAGLWMSWLSRRFALHFTPAIVWIAISLFMFEVFVFVLYSLYGRMDMAFGDAILYHMIPTVAINTVFAAILYRYAEKLFLHMQVFGEEKY